MIKKAGAKIFAKFIHKKNQKWIKNPLWAQQKTFDYLTQKAKATDFGRDHRFDKIKELKDFQIAVPIRDYEGHRPYVDKMLEGRASVLWPGKPLYYAKTSGTTSGAKFIPLSKNLCPPILPLWMHCSIHSPNREHRFCRRQTNFSSGKSYSQKKKATP